MDVLHIEKNDSSVRLIDLNLNADWHRLEIHFLRHTFTEMRIVASSKKAREGFEIFFLTRHGFGRVEAEGDFELCQEGDRIWKKGDSHTYVFVSPNLFEKV